MQWLDPEIAPEGLSEHREVLLWPFFLPAQYSVAKNVVAAESSFIAKRIPSVNELMNKIL
ncbi:hypothetical protein M1B72_17550 [Geomonas paludis]|uniref:Uncharacterized protein n=1 Tax=Geomonas paludis TaxID=2740185 RepID=A0A6V8MT07_9BACT|nr:hypothetical protein [Geomonas paludis]UPU35231.1 hypothetical protein M1B72_17550 [Geomonas paludis]GFO63220.1 hypothetical protein GMPD_11390 [Geomonas paludis]